MKLHHSIVSLAEGLRDALAPSRCISCLTEGTWYCRGCRALPSPHVLQCIGCKTEHPRGTTCRACREEIPLTGFVSARSYSDQAIQRGIEWLKFKGVRPIREILGGLLIPRLTAIAPLPDLAMRGVLVPIPLHTSRQRARGFNQSEDIAYAISSITSIPVARILTKPHATASQARLPHTLRQENIAHAFSLNISEHAYTVLTNERPYIIIVDDVSTTGATIISAAHAFPTLSHIQLWGAAVARG